MCTIYPNEPQVIVTEMHSKNRLDFLPSDSITINHSAKET